MEEKERYEIHIYDDVCVDLFNNGVLDKSINNTYKLEDLLNQQDKRIKELEEELENYKLCRCVDCSSEYEKGLETTIDELEKENQQLKQQLVITEKALELACEHIKEDLKCDDTENEIYNYFKTQAKEMLENE